MAGLCSVRPVASAGKTGRLEDLLARLWSHLRALSHSPARQACASCCPDPSRALGSKDLCVALLCVAWASFHHGCLGEAVFPVSGSVSKGWGPGSQGRN